MKSIETIKIEERKEALKEIAARIRGNGNGNRLIQRCDVEPLSDGEHTALVIVGLDVYHSRQFVSVLTSYPKLVDLFWGLAKVIFTATDKCERIRFLSFFVSLLMLHQ